jgi:acetate kinase
LQLDPQANTQAIAAEKKISRDGATPEIWVVPTNEELWIARDTARVILGLEHD